MIDLIAIRDYIKAFAQAHSYIQHNEAVRAYNRFVTYDFDESNTGDTGATAFPRLSLVANSRFGGYNGKMEQQGGQPLKATMQMEVSVVNTYPEGNYRRHDEVSNETLKVLTDLVSYLHANQKAQKCHPVLQHINFNSFQFFKTKLQTHGNAIGWALSFELGARIDSDFSGSMPPPLPMPPTPVGSLFYWNGTQYAPLPPAAAGNVLKSQGLNTPPAWEQGGGNETDPIFTTWLNNVAQVAEWNAAYSWGNHAAAGYASKTDLNDKEDKANKNTGTLTNNPNTYPSEKTVYDAIQAVSTPNPLQVIDIIEDFTSMRFPEEVLTSPNVGYVTDNFSFVKPTGGTLTTLYEDGKFGIKKLDQNYAGATANFGVTSAYLHRQEHSGIIKITCIFKLTEGLNGDGSGRNIVFDVGLFTSPYPVHASCDYISVQYNNTSTQFQLHSRRLGAGGGTTVINTGVTVALDTWYKVELEVTSTTATAKIDDVVVATIPWAILMPRFGYDMKALASLYKKHGGAIPIGFAIDYFQVTKILDNPR